MVFCVIMAVVLFLSFLLAIRLGSVDLEFDTIRKILINRLTGRVTDALPATPDDFVPAVRLVVFTDSHNQNHNVADAIDTSYALFDNDAVYPGVDGFFGS